MIKSEICSEELDFYKVFDRYFPISFCPNKGVIGKLTCLPKVNFFAENKQEKLNIESWTAESQNLLNEKQGASICLIEVVFPVECWESFKRKAESSVDSKSSLETKKYSAVQLKEYCIERAKAALEKRRVCSTQYKSDEPPLQNITEINFLGKKNVLEDKNDIIPSSTLEVDEKYAIEQEKKSKSIKKYIASFFESTTKNLLYGSPVEKPDSTTDNCATIVDDIYGTQLTEDKQSSIEQNDSTMKENKDQQKEKNFEDIYKLNEKLATGTSVISDSSTALGEEDNDSLIKTEIQNDILYYNDISDDITHVADFYKQLETLNLKNHEHSSKDCSFLACLATLLKTAEELNFCSAIVLLFRFPDYVPLNSINVSCHINKTIREDLKVPAIEHHLYSIDIEKKFLENMSSEANGAITPIPIKIGDHIYRQFRDRGTLKIIQHHGIYIGNGQLIHFSGSNLHLKDLIGKTQNAKIQTTSIFRFMNKTSRLKIRHYKKEDPPEIVIERAQEALTRQTFPKYNLLKNNCEHFCYYCKTGKVRSKQVEKSFKYAAIAGSLAMAATVLAITVSRKR